MSNSVAVWLFALILAAIALDYHKDWGATLFVLRKLFDLIHAVQIWR